MGGVMSAGRGRRSRRPSAVLAPLLLAAMAATMAAPAIGLAEVAPGPLAPPDTSSPRATLESFRENMRLAFEDAYRLGVPLDRQDRLALGRVVETMDTSELPPVRAERSAVEAALMLNDVLDRVSLPDAADIPDRAAMAALPPGDPRVWRVPGTEIAIARVGEGNRAGEYLIAPETIARAFEFYQLAQNMPYKAGAMEGLFRRISREPGPNIPAAWIRALPEWMMKRFDGQAIWKWIAMFITAGAYLLLVYAAHRVTSPRGGERRYWLRVALALLLLPVTAAFRTFYEDDLLIVGPAYVIVDDVIVMLFYVIWAVARPESRWGGGGDDNFEPEVRDADPGCELHQGVLLRDRAIVLIAVGLSKLGVPLAAVIASLGVGGVAFALAAGPTLQNLIAGITLYLDKPVRVGQFCQFGDVLGTVESVGLRSVRIRRWGGNLLSIPNAQFIEQQLDNYADARNIWIRERLRMRHETTPQQLAYVLAKIREMLFAHPKILLPRVRLIGLGDDALTVEVLCYTDTGVWAEWHAIREDLFLRVLEIVDASGTRLALPSKTVYYARDGALDEERRRAAEEQVRDWIASGELPFPDMTQERIEALAGTLDFPPEGSVLRNSESEAG